MISILWIAVVTALAVGVVLARKYVPKPKKAQKWEKAQIMKQLLAMSENEIRGFDGCASTIPNFCETRAAAGEVHSQTGKKLSADSFQQIGFSWYRQSGGCCGRPPAEGRMPSGQPALRVANRVCGVGALARRL